MNVYLRDEADPMTKEYLVKELPAIGSSQDADGFVYSSGFSNCVCMNQRGSTCGLYALAMILRKMSGRAILATVADVLPVQLPLSQAEGGTVLYKAIENGDTTLGEMFDPADIVKLYRQFMPISTHSRCKVVDSTETTFSAIIKEQLDKGGLVMVPYCIGSIQTSHWVVAVGYRMSGDAVSDISMATYGTLTEVPANLLSECNSKIPGEPGPSCTHGCQADQASEYCVSCRTCGLSYADVRPIEQELKMCYGNHCPDFKEGWTGTAKVSQLRNKLILFDV